MKASDGHREYRKCPEMLQNCSTGFHFPTQSEETMQVTHFCFCSFPNFIRANCNEIATFFFTLFVNLGNILLLIYPLQKHTSNLINNHVCIM